MNIINIIGKTKNGLSFTKVEGNDTNEVTTLVTQGNKHSEKPNINSIYDKIKSISQSNAQQRS